MCRRHLFLAEFIGLLVGFLWAINFYAQKNRPIRKQIFQMVKPRFFKGMSTLLLWIGVHSTVHHLCVYDVACYYFFQEITNSIRNINTLRIQNILPTYGLNPFRVRHKLVELQLTFKSQEVQLQATGMLAVSFEVFSLIVAIQLKLSKQKVANHLYLPWR